MAQVSGDFESTGVTRSGGTAAPESPGVTAAEGSAGGSRKGSRRRNARGEGSRLANEIVDGAIALIARSGSEAVTLRSVAREVGIAAPSIYAHFPDRTAILEAAVVRTFEDLLRYLEEAVVGRSDPLDRLVAGCEAYVTYGLENPGRYAALFLRGNFDPGSAFPVRFPFDELPPFGGDAFAVLVEGIRGCVEAGISSSTDPFADATALWVALHGTISIWTSMCEGNWPEERDFVRGLAMSLARVDPDRYGSSSERRLGDE
jgi:AcrR family transcriptional regulator